MKARTELAVPLAGAVSPTRSRTTSSPGPDGIDTMHGTDCRPGVRFVQIVQNPDSKLLEAVRDVRKALVACAVVGWLAVLLHLVMEALKGGG